MTGRLEGKVAIFTGGEQGLGFGMAQAFVKEGAKVVITGRVAEKLEAKAKILRDMGGEVLTVPGDVGKRSDVKDMIAKTLAAFGRIDILVNNAQSLVKERPLHEFEDRHIESSIQSGLFGTIYCMQEAYHALKVRGGSIINFGSALGVRGTARHATYAAAKEGIRGLSRVAAKDWGKDNIRVNVICPGSNSESAVNKAMFVSGPDRAGPSASWASSSRWFGSGSGHFMQCIG